MDEEKKPIKLSDQEIIAVLEASNYALRTHVDALIAQRNFDQAVTAFNQGQSTLSTLIQSILRTYGCAGHEISRDYEIVPKTSEG